MTINGVNGVNMQVGQMGMNQAADSYSRNIQSRIVSAQKQLQELSSNENMTLEEKMKKRQEIQQQISELNVQLRQHQVEQRREKQQAESASMNDMSGGTRDASNAKAGSRNTSFSQASMTAMISADNSMKLAKMQGGVATQMKDRAGVLEAEIKLDASRGMNIEKKQEELADMKQKAQEATAYQISALAEADKALEEAAETDNKTEKADSGTAKGADLEETVQGSGSRDSQSDVSVSESAPAEDNAAASQPAAYISVDVRL